MWRNLTPPRPHGFENILKFEPRLLLSQAPSGGVTDAIDQACRSYECLTRNAAVIKAVASHLISFDECNPPAKCRCTGGGYQPGSASADHNYIIWGETFRFAHS